MGMVARVFLNAAIFGGIIWTIAHVAAEPEETAEPPAASRPPDVGPSEDAEDEEDDSDRDDGPAKKKSRRSR